MAPLTSYAYRLPTYYIFVICTNMPALTDRERAKRAKMVARFNAIKHHNNIAESMTAPQAEKVAGNQENRLYKKEPIQISVGNNDRDVVTDEEVREEAEATAVEPPQQEVVLESKLENSSGPTVRSKPPNVTLATTTPSISTTRKTALSVEIPLTPSKNTPRARSTPRSRRNTSIADAKKKLAAARKVSSSSKPRIEKDDLKDHAKEIAVKLDRNEWDENPAKVESMAENENEKEGLSNEKKEIQEKSSIVVKHKIGTKSKISITSPGGRRSDKIAKIRARSPRIADRHKGLVKASAQLDEPIEPKKSLSVEFAKVAPTEREKETKKPSSDEFAYTKERWSDEFNEPIRPQPSADDAPYLGDVFDNQRLSYGSDSSTTRDQSKNLKKLSAEMNTHMMSDEFSSPRLSIESGTTVASGSTLLARDREAEQQHQKPKMQKTWQEQSKIVAKAKQYRKWQHHTTTTTKKTDISVVEPIVERFEEVKEGHLHLGSYEGNVQQGDLFEPKLRAASKMRDGMSESEPPLFEPKPQSNVESFCGLVDSEDDEFEPQTRSNGLSGLVDVKEGLFEPRPQYKSDDNLGPECPLDPSQIAYLHENQEYHIEEEEVQEEEARSKVKENDRSQAIGDATETQLIPARQFSMSNSTPGSSVVKPSTIATVDTEQVYPTTTQYKTLVPSRSDASKHSELSLNQLTVSTSEVQSLAGVEFLSMSKDTDAQHRSDDFEDDQFQSQFDWPVDAFSPTSWGAGQAEPSSSEDSNWEKAVPDTPNSLTAPATAEDKSGWDFKGASSAVEWEAEKENEPTKKTEDEWDSSWGQTELDDTQNDTADEREDGVDEKARREAEERINELNELDICGVSDVDQYEGFSEDEHADCPSRMESKDGYSPRAEYSNVLSPSGESKCSEGTMGTATEFDPISMFEASESFSVDIEKKDSFPTCDVNKNIESVASWSSAKVLKPNDDSTNSAFGSLRAGNPMDTSTLFGNDKSAMDTPSGRESLGSWWQNRYASTQNNDINAAVQDALNETTSSEEQRSDRATERCTSSSRCRPEFETPKHLGQQSNGMLQDPLSARAKRFLQDEPSSPDDDSIFGDLDDDSLAGAKHHTSSATNSRRKSSLSKMGTIISNAETDDIFAGVSVNSRQAKPQKDSSAVPMKSLLDGSTTTGSQSIHQKTKSSSKEPECNLPKVEEQTAKPIGLFMMDGTYGVINVKDSERNSPSNASVTSDITTSVIFGGDYGKKRSFSKKGASYSLDRESPDTIIEVPDVLSDKPVCSPRKGHTSAQDQTFDNEDTENVDPQGGGQGDINAQNNEDFQKASDAADEATETSNPSLLKRAFLMVEKGKNLVGDSTKAKCAPPESSVGKAGAAVFMLPLALPMACGMLGASSFAYCASKGERRLFSSSIFRFVNFNYISSDTQHQILFIQLLISIRPNLIQIHQKTFTKVVLPMRLKQVTQILTTVTERKRHLISLI